MTNKFITTENLKNCTVFNKTVLHCGEHADVRSWNRENQLSPRQNTYTAHCNLVSKMTCGMLNTAHSCAPTTKTGQLSRTGRQKSSNSQSWSNSDLMSFNGGQTTMLHVPTMHDLYNNTHYHWKRYRQKPLRLQPCSTTIGSIRTLLMHVWRSTETEIY